MTGTGGLKRIPREVIKSYKIPVPPNEVQSELINEFYREYSFIEGNKKLIEIYTQKIQERINKVWGN